MAPEKGQLRHEGVAPAEAISKPPPVSKAMQEATNTSTMAAAAAVGAAAAGVAMASPPPQDRAADTRDRDGGEASPLHEEGSIARRGMCILQGGVIGSVTFGVVNLATGGDAQATEDVVDLAHSVYTSSVAVRGILSLEPHRQHIVALPSRLIKDDGAVVRMFCRSIGFFFADVLLILVERCMLGRKPHLWAGRLAHHFIQAFANLTAIFRTETREQTVALRTVLGIAYFAEFSNIFLRLGNIFRRGAASSKTQKPLNALLLLSFFASRMVNFPFAIYAFWRARPVVSTDVLWTVGGVQVAGYLLNLGWFLKIVKIIMKPAVVPSIEC